MLQVGKRRSQARETAESSAANTRFRNLNSAILMQRLTMSGEVIRLGLNSTHLAVVQVIAESTGEILYTVRSQTQAFRPRVYGPGKYTIKAGKDKPDTIVAAAVHVE
jgi:hypothetical protein